MKKNIYYLLFSGIILSSCHQMNKEIDNVVNTKILYQSREFTVYNDSVVQGSFVAKALSRHHIISNYESPADKISPVVKFKFSINGADNAAPAGKDNIIVCGGDKEVYESPIIKFGSQYMDTTKQGGNAELKKGVQLILRVDMTDVLKSFKTKGYYQTFDGKKIFKNDFQGVFVAGNVSPLTWDWNNLYSHKELQMSDSNHDGIYEIRLTLNQHPDENKTAGTWRLSRDIRSFPQYESPDVLPDAIYNLSLEEMLNAIEPDSTFRTGKEWAGVWTRDISYSIILSMAILQPGVAMISLKKKVKNGKIIQDTGTGGAYPISTDREIWAVAAWEVYKVTGDNEWLSYAYQVIKNSINDDLQNIYDPITGMAKGESSFLDWREQTYPAWMQPADIYESECVGTNAVHFKANIVLSEMAALLGNKEDEKKYRDVADKIKKGVNQYLWQKDKGYFGQYLYGRNFKILSPKSEALGEALSVYFDLADEGKQKSIISNTPVTPFGITCIYPQIPGIPPYHNDAVWPFVESYWALASAKAGNEQSVVRAMCAVYRPAALFLTNKENFVASDGDYAGTQINSSNMLWSLSGNISLVYRLLFGMQFNANKLSFSPFVPKAFEGKRTLTNFKYRKAILNIEMTGHGNRIASFMIDGKESSDYAVPANLVGPHHVTIKLANTILPIGEINSVENLFSPQMPAVTWQNGRLSWADTSKNIASIKILKNGVLLKNEADSALAIDSGSYGDYQIIAVDKNKFESFASEPLQIYPPQKEQIIQLEKFASKSNNRYKGFSGDGFVEISKSVNQQLNFSININEDGDYIFDVKYANGNGPVNTENKCAFRSIAIDSKKAGTLVFPQRGKDEWSNWGWSNSLKIHLSKGVHQFSILLESWNENMNGEVNQAMLDCARLIQIDKK
jgi:hypothetical protein